MRNKLFLIVIAVVFLLGGLTIYWWYSDEPKIATVASNEYLLFMGLDQVNDVRRTDTIILAKLEDQQLKLLSVPRDLQIKLPSGASGKINEAYAIGGAELTARIVSELFGLPVRSYIVADFQGVSELVNAVGGVQVTVANAMQYQDTKQNLNINLAAGTQTLSGDQALQYLRFRESTYGDLGRIQRQQEFLGVLAQKLSQNPNLEQVKNLVGTALKYIKTNISSVDLYRLADRVKSFTATNMKFSTLPGRGENIGGVSYFLTYPLETAALIEEFFHGKSVLTNSDVNVVVLNGFPDPVKRMGLAKKTNDFLVSQSFKVPAYWNAEAYDYQNSYIINISGDAGKAQRLASVLKDPTLQILTPADFAALPLAEGVTYRETDRFKELSRMLLTTAVAPSNKGVDLNSADLLLILGGGSPIAQTGGQ